MAFRCSNCNLNWPANNAYVKCPRCDGRTSHMVSARPMTASEAKHEMFEIYYQNRESKRAQEWLERVSAAEFEAAS